MKYKDLDYAVQVCLKLLSAIEDNDNVTIYFSKADMTLAFRILPLLPRQYCWLVIMAEDPEANQKQYFIDKCLPFGASISCALFQQFSDALAFITEQYCGVPRTIPNYLDDFFFIALIKEDCNNKLRCFILICGQIGCPILKDKTEWSSPLMVFLGILLDGRSKKLCIPAEKRQKALNLLNWVIKKKKSTVKNIERLTGTLNFLSRAIFPGQAFTRQMYSKLTNQKGERLKHYHHVTLDSEFISDTLVWKIFLTNCNLQVWCCPFVDQTRFVNLQTLNFYTDSSVGDTKGFGCIFNNNWTCGLWGRKFINNQKPTIQYLALYTLCIGIFTWADKLSNMRVIIFCDNQAVVEMVNNYTSSCRNCTHLIQLLVLNCLIHNRRIKEEHFSRCLKLCRL